MRAPGIAASCSEVDVASQGGTVTEARDNLAEMLTMFFETVSSVAIDRCLPGGVYVTHAEAAIG